MPRVILDAVRRFRGACALLLVTLTTGWVLALRPGVPPAVVRLAYAVSFYVDLFVFLQLSAGPESPRSLRLVRTLPIRRRDLGADVWLFAVIAPALVTTVAKTLAVGIVRALSIATPVDLPWLMFSGLFDLAYIGSMCWLPALVVRAGFAIGIGRLITLAYWALGGIFCVYVGGAMALARYMPTGWHGWRWHTALVLAGLLGLTVASRFRAARLAELEPRLLPRVPSAPSAPTERAVTLAPRVPFDSRLSGVRRLLWQQFRSAAITSAVVMSLLVPMSALPWSKTPSRLEQIRQGVSTLPAEAGAMLWVLGLTICVLTGTQRWHATRILLLRALPISSREINLLLLMRPVVTGLAFWLALLPIYCLSPAALHPWTGLGMLVGLIGAAALTSTAMLRWHRSQFTNFAVIAVFYLLQFGHPWTHINSSVFGGGTGQLVGLALGICCIAAASAWNHRLLTHSSTLYGRTR